MSDLLSIIDKWSPRPQVDGTVRMTCPFRNKHGGAADGMKSMVLYPETGTYHCWSCKSAGPIVGLLVGTMKVPYFEAAGLVAQYLVSKPEKKHPKFEIEIPWELGIVPEFYRDRGFSERTLRKFHVGTTEDGWMAVPFYADGGLQGVQYRKDSYKDRFMKNNEGFELSKFIYNYEPSAEEVVLVEGYGDVWRLFSFGEHAEGLLGTTFGEDRAEMMAAHKKIYIATDNDLPGRRAAELIVYRMRLYRTELLVVPYLEKDPGTIRKGWRWREYKAAATSYAEYSAAMTMYDEKYLQRREEWCKQFKKAS